MVNTRQNHSTEDFHIDMPVRDDEVGAPSTSNHKRDHSDKSGLDHDSDDEPLRTRGRIRERPRWRREMSTRYSTNFRNIERVSRHRACRMRIVEEPAIDSEDDLMDDSDIQYNVDEEIFSPRNRTKYNRVTRRLSEGLRRTTRHAPAVTEGSQEIGDSVKIEHGDKEEDEEEGEGEGVRRSKRQRKLLYDNFNQSWILGTQTVLRGYPDMYRREPENADGTSNSNDEGPSVGIPPEPANKDKPIVENGEEDMYTKVKRTRRNRIRYSPSSELRPELRSKLRPRGTRERVTVGDSTESESGGASSDDGERRSKRRVYHLRQNKPMVNRFQISEPTTRKSSRLVLCQVSSRRSYPRKRRDSSSSDEERFQRKKALSMAKARSRCMPLNFKPTEVAAHQKTPVHSSKPVSRGHGPIGPADVDPMAIDTSITFEKVGGLDTQLRCLKEMVALPMLYHEIYDKFQAQPPKGVLFHGPPGTGKTLIARALANECSKGDRKVSFFMRKGADCLSKWVGESERQLRLLFEQAYQMRPSIIFFDEIDGLAPVRSSKQDQIHASIVSTLLALLDGVDNRQDVIVIGATNRLDAIDPALRRPGRFDRELFFPLPSKKERIEILRIHTKAWDTQPPPELLEQMAEVSVGYSGSDLQLLCTEAVIGALRRRYPQIYKSSKKLLLQRDEVNVEAQDFIHAHSRIVPASCRVNACPRAKLPANIAPLLQAQFDLAVSHLKSIYPHAAVSSAYDPVWRKQYNPRFLLSAPNAEYGQKLHIAPALLELMEHIPVHILSLANMFDTIYRAPEEAIIQIFHEAIRKPPSILYLPGIDDWWDLIPATSHRILLDQINQIPATAPVLILGTTSSDYKELNVEIKSIFKFHYQELRKPTEEERSEFFRPLLTEEPLKEPPPAPLPESQWEELPEAPPPKPPPPSKKELDELHNAEEHRLRGLRLFLRDICGKLARNRQFFMFTKPVDIKEVPDYLTIIQKPMDLETMMANIDLHVYNSAQEFLADVDLIVANALEYNPERDSEDKLIRHRACSLRDTAYTLIKEEMDTDFEQECQKISKRRSEAKGNSPGKTSEKSNEKTDSAVTCNGHTESANSLNNVERRRRVGAPGLKPTLSSSFYSVDRIRRRKSNWARGMLTKRNKKGKDEGTPAETSSVEAPKTEPLPGKHRASSPLERDVKRTKPSPPASVTPTSPADDASESPTTTPEDGTPKKKVKKTPRRLEISSNPGVQVDGSALTTFHGQLVTQSDGWTFDMCMDCYGELQRVIVSYAERYDRQQLIQDLEAALEKYLTWIQ